MSVFYLAGPPTPRQRAAMALRGRGYTYARIGAELGVTPSCARWLVTRGRKNNVATGHWRTR